MLTAVPHGLRAQRKRFVLIMTDVKSAFNHTPTAYMDQRYEGLGIPHDLQITEDLESRLRDFLQSIDRYSTFRVRVRHGFTKAKKLNGSLIGGGGRSRFGRACEVDMSTSCFSPFKTLITIYLGVSC